MGLFEKIFGKKNQNVQVNGYFKELTTYTPTFLSWNGSIYEHELVRRSIDAIASHASKLEVNFNGGSPYFVRLVKRKPNEFQTWSQFLYRVMTILEMQNTCFIVPVTNDFGEMTGYFPALPSKCDVVDVEGNAWLRYRFAMGQTRVIELSRCGILTKHQYKDDFFGEKNNALNNVVKMINLQDQGLEEAIKQGASFRFMAQQNNFSLDTNTLAEQENFNAKNFSKEAGGGVLLFPHEYSNIKQIESKPYLIDSEQRALIEKNVFDYFGVNEDIIQNKAYGDTWSAFYEGKIEPFAIQLSDVLTFMTYTLTEIDNGSNVMLSSNRLQYMSTKDKLNFITQQFDRGNLSSEEAREISNLGEKKKGDHFYIRGEYVSNESTLKEINDNDGTNEEEN